MRNHHHPTRTFPLASVFTFAAGFASALMFCFWIAIYLCGWYEPKWSRGENYALDGAIALLIFVPLAALGFALGAKLAPAAAESPRCSAVAGALLGALYVAYLAVPVAANLRSGHALFALLTWTLPSLGACMIAVSMRHARH